MIIFMYSRKLVLLAHAGKNCRSASLGAGRQSLLVLSSNGRAKARVTRGQMARGPPCGKRGRSQERESFVLRTSIECGMG